MLVYTSRMWSLFIRVDTCVLVYTCREWSLCGVQAFLLHWKLGILSTRKAAPRWLMVCVRFASQSLLGLSVSHTLGLSVSPIPHSLS